MAFRALKLVGTSCGAMPSPDDLRERARRARPKPRYVLAGDYAEVVHVLRTEKHYTWSEVQRWLAKYGAEFSTQAIISAYRKRYSP